MTPRKEPPARRSNGRAARVGRKRAPDAPGAPRPAGGRRRDDAKPVARSAPPPPVHDPHAEREASRYARPIPSREAILALLARHGALMKVDRVALALGLDDPRDLEALSKRLAAMQRDGQLVQNRRGGFGVAERLNLIPGSVLANAEGYGFLRPDDGGEDLYLSPAEMRKVLHGDRVLGSVVGIDRRGRRQGAIVEVLERRATRLVGRIVEERGMTLVEPDDRRLHQNVLIPPGEQNGARSGQIVIAEITAPPSAQRGPIGRVVGVLGDRLTPSLIVEMTIASHDLPHVWPDEVLRDAARVEPAVAPAEIAGRIDLRGLPLVTIDGEDAKDFDDAVFAEPRPSGGFRLVVAIADVSHYVVPGTPLDGEAFRRATSVYFPGYVVPMLPETLSNGICSLNPGVERLCMACDMQVDADGEVMRAKFHPAVMRSRARLTYTTVAAALAGDPDACAALGDLLAPIRHLHRLYRLFAAARRRRGAIDFESTEFEFRLDAHGEVVQVAPRGRNDAHKLIEECMIAANVEAAKFIHRKRIPAPYRVHAPPPASKYEDLLEFLREFHLKLPPHDKVRPADFAALLERVRLRPDAALIESVVLRAQSLAVYQPGDPGHFGLGLDTYTHFTSPIRRYPDLLVHRAIRYALAGSPPSGYRYSANDMAGLCVHCSQCERRADEAERDVDERYKCAWMEKHVGDEYDGIVTGVASFGLFVELTATGISGLVHITQLPNDYYQFDAVRRQLTGARRRLTFRLGDPVRVRVLRADMQDRKIDFALVPKA